MSDKVRAKEDLSKQEATVRDFLNVIFRRKLLIISIVAITTVLVLLLNTMQPRIFESNSRILIQRGERQSALSAGVRYLSWEEDVSSQLEVILSEAVFSQARQFFTDSVNAGRLPKGMLFNPGSVRADVIGESNVFAIRYTDLNPMACQIGCAVVTQAYSDYYRVRKAPPELTEFFEREQEKIRSDLAYWREQKNEFLKKEKFFGMSEEGHFLLDKLSRYELYLSDVKTEVATQKLKVETLKAITLLSGEELEDKLVLSVVPSSLQQNIIFNVKDALQTLRIKEEEYKSKYTEKHPEMIALEKQINDLHSALRKEVDNAYQIEKSILDEFIIKLNAAEEDIEEARAAIEAVPGKETKLNEITHRIALLEEKFMKLSEKEDQSMIALAGSPEWDVIVISPASPPYQKKTKDYVRMALGPFLSLVVALGLSFFLESVDHSLNNIAEVEEYLGTRVLTTISEM